MEQLRKPFFFLAIALAVIIVAVELIGPSVLPSPQATAGEVGRIVDTSELDAAQIVELNRLASGGKPPGFGVRGLAAVDGILLYSIVLMALSLLVGEYIHARAQGILTLVAMILLLLALLAWGIMVFVALMIMLSLLMAAPFGTIVYMAIYGFFPRGQASAMLGLIMTLKVGFAVSIVLAHQRFLQNLGLVLLILTSLIVSVIVSFLHGLVPGPLVSITDAIAAIIVTIVGAIWAIYLLITSVLSILAAIRR
jgi:hypothetical protein